jgi:alpha-1,3-mannosyl-glycoprotein beta-1,2-N-acetylglucosaminyltransferase
MSSWGQIRSFEFIWGHLNSLFREITAIFSRHYKFALQKTFEMFPSSFGTIIVEDDLLVSADFVDFFRKFAPLLSDPAENLFCLSTWNDNGKDDQIEQNPELVFRTDFFGGLGWMLSKKV